MIDIEEILFQVVHAFPLNNAGHVIFGNRKVEFSPGIEMSSKLKAQAF